MPSWRGCSNWPTTNSATARMPSTAATSNAERAAEEPQGTIRWLRPELQNPQGVAVRQAEPPCGGAIGALFADEAVTATPAAPGKRTPWAPSLRDQMAVLTAALGGTAQSVEEIAGRFSGKGKWKTRLPELLKALETLGRARWLDDGRWMG
jgi:hypothetical protein